MKIEIKLMIVITLLMIYCVKNKANINTDCIKIDITNRGNFILNGIPTYILELRITNNCQSDTAFWNWSCSITESLIFNSNRYEVLSSNCNSNYPILITLKPEESLCLNFLIITKHETCSDFNINVGYIFIPKSNYVAKAGINFVDIVEAARLKGKQVIYCESFNLLTNREQTSFKLSPCR